MYRMIFSAHARSDPVWMSTTSISKWSSDFFSAQDASKELSEELSKAKAEIVKLSTRHQEKLSGCFSKRFVTLPLEFRLIVWGLIVCQNRRMCAKNGIYSTNKCSC